MSKDDKKENLFNILLNDDDVNNYTKMYIILKQREYFKNYYIPNKFFIKILKTDDRNVRKLLKKFEEKDLIIIYYKGDKRYFEFKTKEKKIENKIDNDILNYDWLNDNNFN